MTKKKRVVITGTGAISALGDSSQKLWQKLLQGKSGISRLPDILSAGSPVTTGGTVKSIPYQQIDRDIVIASKAIEEALLAAKLTSETSGFIWATGLDTFYFSEGPPIHCSSGESFTKLAQNFSNPRYMIATACASSTQAIGESLHIIRAGNCDICVAGGSSVMLNPLYLVGFSALHAIAIGQIEDDPSTICQPFDRKRQGLTLADGAGALVMEDYDFAKRRNAEILSEVLGFGVSQDAFDLNRPPADGVGAELCIKRALQDANLREEDIDVISAHATGTHIGDLAEANALRRVFARSWQKTPVFSVKGAIGHPMSASGALQAIVSVYICLTGIVPATVNLTQPDAKCNLDHVIGKPRHAKAKTVLSVSFGMGGQNAAVIFRRFYEK